MGGNFKIKDNMLSILGGVPLKSARVQATDLRAGAALALAALLANGETIIQDGWQIDRGYHRFYTKMSELGANILVK